MKIYISCLLAAAVLSATGAGIPRLNISNLAVLKSDNSLTINLKVPSSGWKIKSNQKVVFLPVVVSGSDTVMLDPLTVAGPRAWFYEVRNGEETPFLVKTGNGKGIEYSRTIDWQSWMERSAVEILADTISVCGCDDDLNLFAGTIPLKVAELNTADMFRAPRFRYEVPGDTLEKNFALSGRANIRFMVNKTDIDWSYAGNYAELDSILASINKVKGNPDATVREISLCGYASPEGPYTNNVRLAKGRTEVVKEYVIKHSSFPESIYKTSYVPEDWDGLRQWLVNNPEPGSKEMIAFIDNPKVPVETKNDLFRERFPQAYPGLLREVYPLLRHTDYRITYNVRKYYDVEEIRRVMKVNPRNLSQNELYLLAKSYPQGSPEYLEVFTLAARLFPDDTTANLNAASASMNAGDLSAAASYLQRAGDSAKSEYSRGLLEAMNGDFTLARSYMENARILGSDDVDEALKEIARMEEIMLSGGVRILQQEF